MLEKLYHQPTVVHDSADKKTSMKMMMMMTGVLGRESWGGGGNHGVAVMVRESWDESPRAIEFLSVASSNTVNKGQ